MNYFYIKALHIIFVVTWFAGLFYIVRLFIYNREAQDKSPEEKTILTQQFNIMIQRLYWAITLPSAILVTVFGGCLLTRFWPFDTWLILKLIFVFILYLYHASIHKIAMQQNRGIFHFTSKQLRLWNEVPTLFLVMVVFLVVVKNTMGAIYGFIGVLVVFVLIMIGIKSYKRLKTKQSST